MVRMTTTIHWWFEYLTIGQQYVTVLDNGVHKNNTLELNIMIVWLQRIVHSFDKHVIRWMGWFGCTGSSICSTSMWSGGWDGVAAADCPFVWRAFDPEDMMICLFRIANLCFFSCELLEVVQILAGCMNSLAFKLLFLVLFVFASLKWFKEIYAHRYPDYPMMLR